MLVSHLTRFLRHWRSALRIRTTEWSSRIFWCVYSWFASRTRTLMCKSKLQNSKFIRFLVSRIFVWRAFTCRIFYCLPAKPTSIRQCSTYLQVRICVLIKFKRLIFRDNSSSCNRKRYTPIEWSPAKDGWRQATSKGNARGLLPRVVQRSRREQETESSCSFESFKCFNINYF